MSDLPRGLSTVLVKHARLFAPDPPPEAVVDILMVGDRVAAIGLDLTTPAFAADPTELDAEGRIAIPGLIDQHVHIAGGGGEGGPQFRTPEIPGQDLTQAGITTVVGVLGTDGVTRSIQGLLAKARSLWAEHLRVYVYTGAYQVPTRTVTDTLRSDLILIDLVVGVGEVAVSDQRGNHPSVRQLAELSGEARVGGLLGGKAGVLHVHVGDGPGGIDPLERVVASADVPLDTLVPTHLNRNQALVDQAIRWTRAGGWVDFTSGIRPDRHDRLAVSAHEAWQRVRAAGVPMTRVSFSSDAQGSAPLFDSAGHLVGVGVGRADSLIEEVLALVDAGVPWTDALAPVTTVPASILHLGAVGRVQPGGPADVVVLEGKRVWHLVSRGHVLVRDGMSRRLSPFLTSVG
ncbi:MAG: beta-aspartyl-peptidase [Thermaerobacter sp.]|nr:beta-aspartyl-peptidase [Thermaerobacter sp.]